MTSCSDQWLAQSLDQNEGCAFWVSGVAQGHPGSWCPPSLPSGPEIPTPLYPKESHRKYLFPPRNDTHHTRETLLWMLRLGTVVPSGELTLVPNDNGCERLQQVQRTGASRARRAKDQALKPSSSPHLPVFTSDVITPV